jgi:methyl-accepting chemotaxis protein
MTTTDRESALENGRRRAAMLLAAVNRLHPVVAAIAAWAAGTGILLAAGLSLALVVAVELAARQPGPEGRLALAVAMMAQPAILVGALAGHAWQVDAHMYFFAMLAALSVLTDARAIVAAAAVVAVHHLALNFAVPALIFGGGPSLGRTVMHALILVMETAALVYMIAERQRLEAEAEQESAAAREAGLLARAADDRAAAMRAQTLALLEAQFSAAVERGTRGDFSARIEARFDEPAMTRLADGLNALFGRIDTMLLALDEALGALARGDLTARMQTGGEGRFRACRDRTNQTIDSLRAVVAQIVEAAADARGAADRIREESAALSSRAGAQAASVEETAAVLEQLSATLRSNGDQLARAEGMVRDAAEKTAHGEDAARAAVTAVARIEESSARINEIISLIEGIAFQTNLLALNAAVEAARAGDAGRGFAVVASEVRTLSQRTTDAARTVSGLVRDSGAAVSEGVRQVRTTGEALSDIAGAVAGLRETVHHVARTGREQATGIGEVSGSLTRIDAGTQANASTAEDAARSAVEMFEVVRRLDEIVAGFHGGAPARRRVA